MSGIIRIIVPKGIKVQIEYEESDDESQTLLTDFVKETKSTSQNHEPITPEMREIYVERRRQEVGKYIILEDGKEGLVVSHVKGSQFKVLTTDKDGRSSIIYASQRRFKGKPDVWLYWKTPTPSTSTKRRGGKQNWPNPVKRCSICGKEGANKRTHPHHCRGEEE